MAFMISNIGGDIPVDYNFFWSGQTFATPAAAKRYLDRAGYRDTKKHKGYDKNLVYSMLQTERPVFIGALSGGVDGHAWVIDGLFQECRTVQCENLENGRITTYVERRAKMVHCNWGWDGGSDGYYVSGIFDTGKGPEFEEVEDEPTAVTTGKKDGIFDHHFRIVTYAKP